VLILRNIHMPSTFSQFYVAQLEAQRRLHQLELVPTMKSKSLSTSGAKETGHSTLGAPSQHNQGSRKGKRAWRKNVDIGEVEEGLEGMRAEERVTGYANSLNSNNK
jgi:hypothetical protein